MYVFIYSLQYILRLIHNEYTRECNCEFKKITRDKYSWHSNFLSHKWNFSCNLTLTVPLTVKEEKKIFLFQFLGFIPQSSILRTQTVIIIQLCSCWKVEVSSIKIFQIFFDMHHVLTIFSAGKFCNGLVTVLTESMADFYFVPRNIYINMVQNSADSEL